MLMCSEPTISCICSSVGRLTVDMGPPSGVAAATSPAPQFAIAHCGRNLKRRRMGDRRRLRGARHWPARARAVRRRCDRRGDEAARRPGRRYRDMLRAPPRPSSSAIAPPCTAPTSSSRVMRPRSTSTMRLATSSTSSRFCSTISIESRCFSRRPPGARRSPARSTAGFLPTARREGEATARHERPRRAPGSAARRRTARRPCGREAGVSRGKSREHPLDRRSSVSPESGVQPGEDFRARSGPDRMPRPCGT